MNCVHLLCGPVGAGKTTYARQLETERRAVRLSVDEWMLHLYGPHMPKELFHQRLEKCLELVFETAVRIARVGTDVVVDGGFWRRTQRERAIALLSGVVTKLYFLKVTSEERWARLERRNILLPPGTYEITRAMFDEFEQCFEAPDADEPHVVVLECMTSVPTRREPVCS